MDSTNEGCRRNWFRDESFSVLESGPVSAEEWPITAFLQGGAEAGFMVGNDDDVDERCRNVVEACAIAQRNPWTN